LVQLARSDAKSKPDKVLRLQDAISQPHFRGLTFDPFVDGHITGFYWSSKDPITLSYFDSLGHRPHGNFLTVMKWLLQGTHTITPKSLTHSLGAVQGPESGSCGVAALNFKERHLGLTEEMWHGDVSSERIRNRYLGKLLIYHATVCEDDVSSYICFF
jgi:hypothetical protein